MGPTLKYDPNCRLCPLWEGAKTVCVPADGPALTATYMVLGEAPGAQEDEMGRPFVGRSGQLLDEALERAGVERRIVLVTNVVKCRPPENRTPRLTEMFTCARAYLKDEIELYGPDRILALGNPAAQTLLQTSTGITKLRGYWHTMRRWEQRIPVMPTWHPAYCLKYPGAKPQFFADVALWANARPS